ncbi:hypothetical protein GBA52_018173 [Prunus armeniaca]|nr:hypothetical protein GBA52_018173 [Prunus armeniaca]
MAEHTEESLQEKAVSSGHSASLKAKAYRLLWEGEARAQRLRRWKREHAIDKYCEFQRACN